MSVSELDVITLGRSSIDIYGQQIGGPLEDMSTFTKAVGGCPANIAIGTSRLGLKSGIITRVGNENFGRFIREQLERESVATEGVITDPDRLTALAILGVRDSESFPLLFYRTDCADAALNEKDVDPEFIARAKAIVVTGTHFSRPHSAGAQRKAMKLIHEKGGKVVFDIDYRPNLWGLAGIGEGESRYVKSETVTSYLQKILPDCDLIVGTEEELHIAGGSENTLEAIKTIRELSKGTIVCKRGPMGCVVFEGDIPDSLEKGIKGDGFPIEVYNTLGAGDAFMSGFLRGWIAGESLESCCTYANACGAFAVSRLLCSPEIPTWEELQYFLKNGSPIKALRHDAELNHLHWVTTRREQFTPIMALACDHRLQLEDIAREVGASFERISDFKRLAVAAAERVAGGQPGFGVFMDGRYGQEALFQASHANLWIARPIEKTGSRPLDFECGGSLGVHLTEWPIEQTIKCLCFYHPDDPQELKERQERELFRAYDACRRTGREILIEIIAGKHGVLQSGTVAQVLERLYEVGIRPDWWKLEGQKNPQAWREIGRVIEERDPHCRGVLILGLDAPERELVEAFQAAVVTPWVKGFAIGRTIFSHAARQWLAEEITDEEAIADMAKRFQTFVEAWTNLSVRQVA
ncbi:bifunctional 5-dehydro-2-deoxygluconokinase/5-dehydro-2-deoxyphosphogluconate aldolase [Gluconobacter japonicus]|uniref:bifunctional 5-dehydro-2-deoxygluconokinase/5-dehydro-2- deoxyphosphogluconate aldolase n=1 Tax=Gluconobacter japonicus TaxID=376620 RepID=UPI001B8BC3A1|nr:5-dehydro-2-deoxygluconokinase [Gluconobacter japonicus]MBS1050349.1 5-dehydro-2-deoxygluconokinase [Gluconobacter japonicus]